MYDFKDFMNEKKKRLKKRTDDQVFNKGKKTIINGKEIKRNIEKPVHKAEFGTHSNPGLI